MYGDVFLLLLKFIEAKADRMRLSKGSITSSSGGMSIDLRASEAAKAASICKMYVHLSANVRLRQ